MYPMVLGDTYGHANFGSFLSFMQFGGATFALALPPISVNIASAMGGKWYGNHFIQAALLVFSFFLMLFPKPQSAG